MQRGIGVVANFAHALVSIVAAELAPMTATGIAATPARGGYTTVFEGWQYPGVRRLAA
ncbi:hypothetical protein [Mycobacterium tuberculosis]|uniref:hypothetical protein n=1 Tax=Mycobacterium tuberculosis TaxID=1773 RepID=UPI00272D54C8|nr:hypothetical protein [Mycobacterium tuberculosis]